MLRPGGAVIVARAGPDHLQQIKRRVLGTHADRAPPKKAQYPAALAENYVRVKTEEAFTSELAAHLLQMTPLVRRATETCRAELLREADRAELACTIDLIISTHRVWLGTGGEPI